MSRPQLSRSVMRVPRPSDKRLAVRVTPDALRHVRARHPWVFEESVTSISHEATAGDLAVIFDNDRKFVALALYDPDSPIQFRILHVGRPVPIDNAWWSATITTALAKRDRFTSDPDADRLAYRIINGESDGLGGLVVDRYAGVLVVKLYSAVWFPHLVTFARALLDATRCEAVVLRLARNLQTRETFGLSDGDVIAGRLPDGAVEFVEAGLRFEADVRAGQKTGHFLDQRANRIRVGAWPRIVTCWTCSRRPAVSACTLRPAGRRPSTRSTCRRRRWPRPNATWLSTSNWTRFATAGSRPRSATPSRSWCSSPEPVGTTTSWWWTLRRSLNAKPTSRGHCAPTPASPISPSAWCAREVC